MVRVHWAEMGIGARRGEDWFRRLRRQPWLLVLCLNKSAMDIKMLRMDFEVGVVWWVRCPLVSFGFI